MTTTSENTKNKGLAALTTNPQKTTRKIKFTDNSAHNQRAKLLDYLIEHGCITTSEARELLGIMSPAPRILELKARGYLINRLWVDWTDEHGIKHRIARYVLTKKQPNASGVAS